MYATFLDKLKQSYRADRIQGALEFGISQCSISSLFSDGRFGAMMDVSLTNEVSKDTSCFLEGVFTAKYRVLLPLQLTRASLNTPIRRPRTQKTVRA